MDTTAHHIYADDRQYEKRQNHSPESVTYWPVGEHAEAGADSGRNARKEHDTPYAVSQMSPVECRQRCRQAQPRHRAEHLPHRKLRRLAHGCLVKLAGPVDSDPGHVNSTPPIISG